jgi:hypothetical protein
VYENVVWSITVSCIKGFKIAWKIFVACSDIDHGQYHSFKVNVTHRGSKVRNLVQPITLSFINGFEIT